MEPLRLSLLDFGRTRPGLSASEVLRWTPGHAARAEALGYARYWLAEHHQPNVAWTAPEVMLPLVGAATSRIRVGTAGVLLQFHAPLKVAEVFRQLGAAFPGRVDMGIARGGLSDGDIVMGLLDERPPVPFDQLGARYLRRFAELERLLSAPSGEIVPTVYPASADRPRTWTLGASPGSAARAGRRGSAYGLALFVHPTPPPVETLAAYHDAYQGDLPPETIVAVPGVCAETEGRARTLAAQVTGGRDANAVVGSPHQCAEQLAAIAERFGTREIVFLDLAVGLEDRAAGIEMLAEAVGLGDRRVEAVAA